MRRWEGEHDFRYLTFSCYRHLPLLGNDAIKQVFVDRLAKAKEKHPYRLIAWVVMPDHAHLLLWPHTPVDTLMHAVKRPVAEAVIRRWRELEAPILQRITNSRGERQFWEAGGGHDRNVRDAEEERRFVDYIHENPCRRGMVDLPHEYRWSSARWYEGLDCPLACDPPDN